MGREAWKKQPAIENPGVASPLAVRLLTRVLFPIVRVLHRATLEGAERSFLEQRRVDFGGRVGFLRIGRKAWVPVVPMAIVGVTAPLLLRSCVLPYLFVWPRLVGVKRYGLSVLAVIGAAGIMSLTPFAWHWRALLALGWAASPLAMLSWLPVRIQIRIGEPIAPETLFGCREGGADDDAVLRRALSLVEAAVQARLGSPSGEVRLDG